MEFHKCKICNSIFDDDQLYCIKTFNGFDTGKCLKCNKSAEQINKPDVNSTPVN